MNFCPYFPQFAKELVEIRHRLFPCHHTEWLWISC